MEGGDIWVGCKFLCLSSRKPPQITCLGLVSPDHVCSVALDGLPAAPGAVVIACFYSSLPTSCKPKVPSSSQQDSEPPRPLLLL